MKWAILIFLGLLVWGFFAVRKVSDSNSPLNNLVGSFVGIKPKVPEVSPPPVPAPAGPKPLVTPAVPPPVVPHIDDPLVWVSYEYKNRSVPDFTGINGFTDLLIDGNLASVRVPESQMKQTATLLATLDRKKETYVVNLALVAINLNESERFGSSLVGEWLSDVDYTGYGMTVNGDSISFSAAGFQLFIDASTETGNARLVATPSLSVVQDQPGLFISGREVAIGSISSQQGTAISSVEFREVAFRLDVTVSRRGSGYLLNVKQLNDDVIGQTVVNGSEVPVLSTEQLETSLHLTGDEWRSVGSLVADQASDSLLKNRVVGFLRDKQNQKTRTEIHVFASVTDSQPVQFEREEWRKVDGSPSPSPKPFQRLREWRAKR